MSDESNLVKVDPNLGVKMDVPGGPEQFFKERTVEEDAALQGQLATHQPAHADNDNDAPVTSEVVTGHFTEAPTAATIVDEDDEDEDEDLTPVNENKVDSPADYEIK